MAPRCSTMVPGPNRRRSPATPARGFHDGHARISIRRSMRRNRPLPPATTSQLNSFCTRRRLLQEASLGPLHPDLANTLNNLGVVCEITGNAADAERHFRRAWEIATATLEPDQSVRRHESKEPRGFLQRSGHRRRRADCRAASRLLQSPHKPQPPHPLDLRQSARRRQSWWTIWRRRPVASTGPSSARRGKTRDRLPPSRRRVGFQSPR